MMVTQLTLLSPIAPQSLASRRGDQAPRPTLPRDTPPLRFLTPSALDATTVFAPDVEPRPLEPSTLEHPRVVEDMRHRYD